MFHDYSFQNYVPSSYLSLPCIMNKNLLRLLAAMESEKNDLWIVVLFLTSIDIKAYCKVSQPGAATPRESWCFGGSRRLSKKKMM